jgi:hypothetical protein
MVIGQRERIMLAFSYRLNYLNIKSWQWVLHNKKVSQECKWQWSLILVCCLNYLWRILSSLYLLSPFATFI